MKSTKMKIKETLSVIFGCLFALAIGIMIVYPIILKMELMNASIDYLNRH